MRGPCENCPWLKDAPREYWDPQHFVDIFRNCQGDSMHVMLCHKANALPVEKRTDLVCQGWVRVLGFDAIGVRLAAMKGKITVEEVNDRSFKLFKSFASMLKANKVKP